MSKIFQSGMLAVAIAIVALASPPALAQFNPSNEDTDLFLVNPVVSAARPNVLIALDNTANWNNPFAVEKEALATVVNGLSDQFNVGLMLFPQTGSPNDNIDGAFVRFGVRQMTDTNKQALAQLVNDFHINNDKGNNATFSLMMYEAYAYYAGIQARAGYGKSKRDFAGNTAYNPYAASLPNPPLVSPSSKTYISPITDACQKNFVIILSNGKAQENTNSLAASQTLLSGIMGVSPPPTIALNPSGAQNNWTDEFAKYMANSDCNPNVDGTQSVYTHVIEIDPGTQKADLDHTALMKSTALNGKGSYFAVSSGNGAQDIVDALNSIFKEVRAVNSVFASTTLPVSVNVRGTNANQVYMGVFRPDSNAAPRWQGNLKLYQLGINTNVNPPDLFLADATGIAAESPTSGFIVSHARSFWTSPSNYWAFKGTYEESDISHASDSPDGPIVEKGAVAQKIRVTTPAERNIYTCTGSCATGSALSGTPFNTDNAAITAVALNVADSRRNEIINWTRGQDLDDENADTSTADVRADVHGDVLHSRPAVINYNRSGADEDNDVFVFYGSNDGIFRAVKGGMATGAGEEVWGFVAPEHFGQLKRVRDNTPLIGNGSKKPYFFDGPIGVYTLDANLDGSIRPTDGDKVYLYLTMRRGGRYIYALDVSDPLTPRFMWKKGCPSATSNVGCDTDYEAIGQTWSEPKVTYLRAWGGNTPVLIFGAGYDAAVEDIQPCLATSVTNASVTTTVGGTVTFDNAGSCSVSGGASQTVSRTIGRGVYVVNALTGAVLWRAGPDAGADRVVADMRFAMPADPVVLNRDRDISRVVTGRENIVGGYADRIYATDTGGQIWRLDVNDASPSNWSVHRLAAISDLSTPAGRRKFLSNPDVVYTKDDYGPYDAVLIGSGDREHPFDGTVGNRFYMFKDRDTGLSVATGRPTITEAAMFDTTDNCVQDCTGNAQLEAKAGLLAGSGWYIRLAVGEKVIGTAATVSGTVFFNTNQPSANACTSSLGIAREYQIGYRDGSAVRDLSIGNGINAEDRSTVHAGGGYLPPPVPLTVRIGGNDYEGVISGPSVREGNAPPLGARLRTHWFKKFD